jgi:hypothetical protein
MTQKSGGEWKGICLVAIASYCRIAKEYCDWRRPGQVFAGGSQTTRNHLSFLASDGRHSEEV